MDPVTFNINPAYPNLLEFRDATFRSADALVIWLTAKGIRPEDIVAPCPGRLKIRHDGSFPMSNGRKETDLTYEQRNGIWLYTTIGNGDLDRLRDQIPPSIPELPECIGVPLDVELRNDSIEYRLWRSNELAQMQGWKFGSQTTSELESIISLLEESLHEVGVPHPETKAGKLLEAYMLCNIHLHSKLKFHTTPDGALSIKNSIDCLLDEGRTKKFLNGIRDAINALSLRKDQIEIVDAGCGALPIFSILAALMSDKVRVTAIELNPDSAVLAQAIVHKFNLQDRIKIVVADARSYAPNRPTDLLISETMSAGFGAESMSEVMHHQIRFLANEGQIVPSSVAFKTALVPIEYFSDPPTKVEVGGNLIPKYPLDLRVGFIYASGDKLDEVALDISSEGLKPGFYFPVVISEVIIGNEALKAWESLITFPMCVSEPGTKNPLIIEVEDNKARPMVKVRYKPGASIEGTLVS